MVNPLGTVTTLTHSTSDSAVADDLDQFSYIGDGDEFIHENCDEALFRPVVAVYSSSSTGKADEDDEKYRQKPAAIGQELIVPVIEKGQVEKQEHAKRLEAAARKKSVQDKLDEQAQLTKKNKSKKSTTTTTTGIDSVAVPKDTKERKKSDTRQPKQLEKEIPRKNSEKSRKNSANQKPDIAELSSQMPASVQKPFKKIDTNIEMVISAELEKIPIPPVVSKKSHSKPIKSEEFTKEPTPPPLPLISNADYFEPIKLSSLEMVRSQSPPPPPPPSAQPITSDRPKRSTRTKSQKASIPKGVPEPPPPPPPEFEELGVISFADLMKGGADGGSSATITEPIKFPIESKIGNQNAEFEIVLKSPTSDGYGGSGSGAVPKPIASVRKSKKSIKSDKQSVDYQPAEKLIEKPKELADFDEGLMIECFEDEYSSIQDSIFIDPVVTTTFVLKKSTKPKAPLPREMLPQLDEQPIATERKLSASTKSTKKSKAIASLDFEFPSLLPLEPFDFEHLITTTNTNTKTDSTTDDAPDQFVSLINFQSPVQESTGYPIMVDDDNQVVIVNDDDDVDDDDDPVPVLLFECQDSDYKSLEQEIDDAYFSSALATAPTTTPWYKKNKDAYSSDDSINSLQNDMMRSNIGGDDYYDDAPVDSTTPSSSSTSTAATTTTTNSIKTSSKYKQDNDEELQPLIGLSVSQEEQQIATEILTNDQTLPTSDADDYKCTGTGAGNNSSGGGGGGGGAGSSGSSGGGGSGLSAVNANATGTKKKSKRKRR